MTNRMNATAIRVGEVPSSNLGAPIEKPRKAWVCRAFVERLLKKLR